MSGKSARPTRAERACTALGSFRVIRDAERPASLPRCHCAPLEESGRTDFGEPGSTELAEVSRAATGVRMGNPWLRLARLRFAKALGGFVLRRDTCDRLGGFVLRHDICSSTLGSFCGIAQAPIRGSVGRSCRRTSAVGSFCACDTSSGTRSLLQRTSLPFLGGAARQARRARSASSFPLRQTRFLADFVLPRRCALEPFGILWSVRWTPCTIRAVGIHGHLARLG